MKNYKIKIGIDPGTNTGFAAWSVDEKEFILLKTLDIYSALKETDKIIEMFGKDSILIRCENPNTWKPFKNVTIEQSNMYKQGAGSVKRDFAIWKDYAELKGVDFQGTKLQGNIKKATSAFFKQCTGYSKQTSQHSRDAAFLVFE